MKPLRILNVALALLIVGQVIVIMDALSLIEDMRSHNAEMRALLAAIPPLPTEVTK